MMKPAIERVLPNSEIAEKSVLGACILEADVYERLSQRIGSEHFYNLTHKTIWQHLKEGAGDMVLLSQRMQDAGVLEECGGAVKLAELIADCPTTAFAVSHARLLEEALVRRQLIETCHEINEKAFDTENVTVLSNVAAQTFNQIAAGIGAKTSRLRPLKDSATPYMEFVNRGEAEVVNLGRWLPSLAKDCGNLAAGEMVLVIGDTGVGKTALAQNLALAVAPVKTALFELELPETLTYPRFQQMKRDLSLSEVFQAHKHGQAREWESDTEFSRIWLCSDAGLSVEEIERRVLVHNAEHSDDTIKVVVVDYFQLLRGKGKSRLERFADEAEACKVAAKRTNAVWLVISQVGRPADDGAYEPTLHDGKETGSLENSSGLVIGIWRDENDSSLLYAKILKNTKGKSGLVVKCNYTGYSLKITERAL